MNAWIDIAPSGPPPDPPRPVDKAPRARALILLLRPLIPLRRSCGPSAPAPCQDALEFIAEHPDVGVIGAIDLFAGRAEFTKQCIAKGIPVRTYEMDKSGYPAEWGDIASGDDDILTEFGLFRFPSLLRDTRHKLVRFLPCACLRVVRLARVSPFRFPSPACLLPLSGSSATSSRPPGHLPLRLFCVASHSEAGGRRD